MAESGARSQKEASPHVPASTSGSKHETPHGPVSPLEVDRLDPDVVPPVPVLPAPPVDVEALLVAPPPFPVGTRTAR